MDLLSALVQVLVEKEIVTVEELQAAMNPAPEVVPNLKDQVAQARAAAAQAARAMEARR